MDRLCEPIPHRMTEPVARPITGLVPGGNPPAPDTHILLQNGTDLLLQDGTPMVKN